MTENELSYHGYSTRKQALETYSAAELHSIRPSAFGGIVQLTNFNALRFRNLSFTNKIIGAAIHLHKSPGPGLLESAYEHALANDLRELGFEVKQQIPIPFI